MELQVTPIGYVHSPYKEKFAVPRQPGLVKSARSDIILDEGFNDPNCLRGIEQFSHLWLIFSFHETREQGWRPLVRPPRLGGNEKIGVFASRSTFRPNGLGMSVVELLDYDARQGKLVIGGADLVHMTPIIDIKPYVAYSDSIASAKSGYASETPSATMPVSFSEDAVRQLNSINQGEAHKQLITEVLAQDPRPAYQREQSSERVYGMTLHELNIQWQVIEGGSVVVSVKGANIE